MRGAWKVLLGLAAAWAIVLVTLPWWLGAVLAPAGQRYGLAFARYERLGYARAALHDVRFARRGLVFTARRVEFDAPASWLLRRASASAAIDGWTLTLPPAPRDPHRPPSSPRDVHAQLRRVLAKLRAWLPRLDATRGSILRGEQGIDLATATWARDRLRAQGTLPSGDPFTIELSEHPERFDLVATLPTFAAGAKLAWTADGVRGDGTWWQQPFALHATFGDRGWIPASAGWRAENWDLPATQLKLGAAFSRVRSSVRADWTGDRFTADVRANAAPSEQGKVPPLELEAQVEGDRTQVRVHTLRLDAPFARALLSAPVTLFYDGRASAAPARLTVEADLARQPWLAADGTLRGEVQFSPRAGNSSGSYAFELAGLRAGKFVARSARLRGDWHWPAINLAQLDLALDDDSHVSARGSLDWPRRELRGVRIDGRFAAGWAARLLPAGVAFERATATVEADGPLEAPRHRGEVHATQVRARRLRPADVTARWNGQERALQEIVLTARTGSAALQIAGLVDERRAEVRALTLTRGGRDYLRLVAPAEVSWRPQWKISGVRLEGDDSSLAVDATLGEAPALFIAAQRLDSDWLADWWEGPMPASRVNALTVRGDVRAGVLGFAAEIDAAAEWEGAWIHARLAADGGKDGARITQLELADERGLMAYADGRVPLRLDWTGAPRVRWDDDAPLEFEASVAPDSPLWPALAEKAGLALDGASLVASVSGTLRRPRGLVRAEVARISRAGGRGDPARAAEITDLSAVLQAGRDGVRLESLTANVAGQPVRALGRLPMDDDAWTTLAREPRRFDWRAASAELTAERIELPALARAFPALPLTAGVLDAAVQLAEGELTGRAHLSGGETRPLPGLGRMLGVEADLALQGRRVEVRNFAAELGGEPVRLTGTAALDAHDRPQLDLRLEGRNVPLVRRPGLLVRTDLDLRARTPERGPTRLSGTVALRDALVMADLAAIIPGGPRGTARHPPYFAVAAEPFSRWPLDIRLGGARAVRVRTTVFSGVATPQFHLTGTLGDPRAVGQLAIDEGRVIFPFASFAVQQGAVRLTEADPTQPQLAVHAISKRLGYELRLEAAGSVASPTLAFSSNPPLESADILLLVTTGQPPAEETAGPTGTQRLTRLGTFLGRGIFQNLGGGEERLEITSGEQMSREGRETYRVEYKLREKLSLTGEYDEYDSYNAGVKYRLYTQEGARREERK